MKFLALLALIGLTLTGCKTIAQIPDSEFANGIHVVSYNSTYYGFKAVLNNNSAKYQQLAADVATTTNIIRTNVLPVFSGASTGDVLNGAVNTALSQLSVSATVTDVIKVALALVETQIHLPANPADKLDNRTKLALSAFFTGVADGLDQAVKDTAPPVAAPPTARLAPPVAQKLVWENK
jgi:hypothetical protein